jgi:hypothetical protein
MVSLLSCFIVDALNPRLAAGHVLQGCEGSRGHWLVRKSAAGAFAQGLIKLDRLQPSVIEVSYVLYPFLVPKCKQTKRKPCN